MKSILSLLDEDPPRAEPGAAGAWSSDLAHSLDDKPQEWLSAIARVGQLNDERAWNLLSGVELMASQVVRRRCRQDLVTASFAISLVLQSGLDRRDCSIVCSLLHRASVLTGLDFAGAVTEGCKRAGEFGRKGCEFLLGSSAETPSPHVESGADGVLGFVRAVPGFDVNDLERWLEGGGL